MTKLLSRLFARRPPRVAITYTFHSHRLSEFAQGEEARGQFRRHLQEEVARALDRLARDRRLAP